MKRIVILGAGISGLSIAFRLQQKLPPADITVLEPADRPGGTIWTLREAGFQVEIGPNGFLDSKPTTLTLTRDLGLESQLIAGSESARTNRYLFVDGRLKLLPGSLGSFICSNVLSWAGKLALLAERFRKRPADYPADETIDAFARRRAGAEVAQTLADALVTGIYAGDPKLLSLPACFPRLAQFEREHGSVLRGFAQAARQHRQDAKVNGQRPRPSSMWSLRPGLRLLVETLAARLENPPLLAVTPRRLVKTGDWNRPTWRVQGDGKDVWEADALVLACPSYRQADLLADLDARMAADMAAIPYNRLAVVALGYRREDVPEPLDGFGFIAPQHTRRDLLGVQWCSSIYPDRAPAGAVLLRAMCGGWQRPEMVGWDDDRLLAALRAELHLAQKISAAPIFHKIIRWDRAIPQYHVGHLARLARLEQRQAQHPGLFLAGNSYHGVALNDCTEQGEVIATRIAAYVQEMS